MLSLLSSMVMKCAVDGNQVKNETAQLNGKLDLKQQLAV